MHHLLPPKRDINLPLDYATVNFFVSS